MTDEKALVPVQYGVVASVNRQIAITEKLLTDLRKRSEENLRSLVDELCNATVWEDKNRAWSILRKMGPKVTGWTELLQNAIYSGDGWARIMAAESLAWHEYLPNDTIPVFVTVIETGIDSC